LISVDDCRLSVSSISCVSTDASDSVGDPAGAAGGSNPGDTDDSPSDSEVSLARISSSSDDDELQLDGAPESDNGDPFVSASWESALISTDAAASTDRPPEVGVFVAIVEEAVVKASSLAASSFHEYGRHCGVAEAETGRGSAGITCKTAVVNMLVMRSM
jgi:hypothetical protein